MDKSTVEERGSLRADRAVMLALAEGGMTYQDIATEMSANLEEHQAFPVGTVKSGIHRARAKVLAMREAAAAARNDRGSPAS